MNIYCSCRWQETSFSRPQSITASLSYIVSTGRAGMLHVNARADGRVRQSRSALGQLVCMFDVTRRVLTSDAVPVFSESSVVEVTCNFWAWGGCRRVFSVAAFVVAGVARLCGCSCCCWRHEFDLSSRLYCVGVFRRGWSVGGSSAAVGHALVGAVEADSQWSFVVRVE